MSLSKGSKIAVTVVVVVIIAVLAYSLFPYAVSTKVNDLKTNQVTYIYGTVQNRAAFGNISAFELNDSTGKVVVIWNGTLPANGQKVLVHGTFKQSTYVFFKVEIFEATSVTYWPI